MKRQTKHIRIGAENHKRLKQASVDTGKTISIIADEIIDEHFNPRSVEKTPTDQSHKYETELIK